MFSSIEHIKVYIYANNEKEHEQAKSVRFNKLKCNFADKKVKYVGPVLLEN